MSIYKGSMPTRIPETVSAGQITQASSPLGSQTAASLLEMSTSSQSSSKRNMEAISQQNSSLIFFRFETTGDSIAFIMETGCFMSMERLKNHKLSGRQN
jgi:hypothetical protein